MKKIIAKICEEIREKNPKSLLILHTNNEELFTKVKEAVEKNFSNVKIETHIISPVIGAHAGPSAFGLGYFGYKI